MDYGLIKRVCTEMTKASILGHSNDVYGNENGDSDCWAS